MAKAIVYELTNIKTGEKFVGTADDISEKLGVSRGYISNQEICGGRIHYDWNIERLDQEKIVKKPNNGSIPQSKRDEWDKVTAPYKKLAAKKASMA